MMDDTNLSTYQYKQRARAAQNLSRLQAQRARNEQDLSRSRARLAVLSASIAASPITRSTTGRRTTLDEPLSYMRETQSSERRRPYAHRMSASDAHAAQLAMEEDEQQELEQLSRSDELLAHQLALGGGEGGVDDEEDEEEDDVLHWGRSNRRGRSGASGWRPLPTDDAATIGPDMTSTVYVDSIMSAAAAAGVFDVAQEDDDVARELERAGYIHPFHGRGR